MKTILIEGTELSGKTTLLKEIDKLAPFESKSIKINCGFINNKSILLQKISLLAEEFPPGNRRELCYTIGLIIDKDPRKIYNEKLDLFFQERSFPSVIAYSKVFHSFGFSKYFGELFLPFYPKFDYNFLITCSNYEREKRFKFRKKLTTLDKKIMEKIELGELLELEMRNLMIPQTNYEEIKTDNLTSAKIAKYILQAIK